MDAVCGADRKQGAGGGKGLGGGGGAVQGRDARTARAAGRPGHASGLGGRRGETKVVRADCFHCPGRARGHDQVAGRGREIIDVLEAAGEIILMIGTGGTDIKPSIVISGSRKCLTQGNEAVQLTDTAAASTRGDYPSDAAWSSRRSS